MTDRNKNLARRWFDEVRSQRKPAAIDELLSPHGVSRGVADPDAMTDGREEFKAIHGRLPGAFFNMRVHLELGAAEARYST